MIRSIGAVPSKSGQPQAKTTHSVTLESACDSSTNRFTIYDADGEPLWSGMAFCGPHDHSVNEFDAALQEVFLLEKLGPEIRKLLDSKAIKVSLQVKAEWVLYGQETHTTSERSAMTVMMWRHDETETHIGVGQSKSGAVTGEIRMGQSQTAQMVRRAEAA